MDPRTPYHIQIEGKECQLDYNVQKAYLQESKYFHDLLNQNPEPTIFTFSNTNFEEYIYILYFSEFSAQGIEPNQINSSTAESHLNQLLLLDHHLQTDYIRQKIIRIIEEKNFIIHLIDQYNHSKKIDNKEEKIIENKLTEGNIDVFFNSQLSQERKMRILSKLSKNQSKKSISAIIKETIVTKKDDEELYQILYSEEEIYQLINEGKIKNHCKYEAIIYKYL